MTAFNEQPLILFWSCQFPDLWHCFKRVMIQRSVLYRTWGFFRFSAETRVVPVPYVIALRTFAEPPVFRNIVPNLLDCFYCCQHCTGPNLPPLLFCTFIHFMPSFSRYQSYIMDRILSSTPFPRFWLDFLLSFNICFAVNLAEVMFLASTKKRFWISGNKCSSPFLFLLSILMTLIL